jgi:hypothetical protein
MKCPDGDRLGVLVPCRLPMVGPGSSPGAPALPLSPNFRSPYVDPFHLSAPF